jgi:hypothetical protein
LPISSASAASEEIAGGVSQRGDGGEAGRRERELIAAGNVKEPAAEERPDRAPKPATRLDHPEDRAQMWPREDVGRNRQSCAIRMPKPNPENCVEQEERADAVTAAAR